MADIERFVAELNATWRSGQFDALARFFHDDVVMQPPGGEPPMIGVGPMVDSYRQFAASATIHDFDVTSIDLFPFDDVVMCHVRFEVDYEIPPGHFHEIGKEVYAVVDPEGAPKIVWRTQLPAPPPPAA